MKGRKPTPGALKVLRGTNQPVRMNKTSEPGSIEKLPPPPAWFGKLAKRIYRTKGQELINQKVLSLLDIDMFVLYCNEFAVYIETSEQIAQIPLKAKLGEEQNEVYKRIRQQNQQAWERAKSIAIEFGFTPSARGRVKILTGSNQMSEFEKLMKGLT